MERAAELSQLFGARSCIALPAGATVSVQHASIQLGVGVQSVPVSSSIMCIVARVCIRKSAEESGVRQHGAELVREYVEKDLPLTPLETLMNIAAGGDEIAKCAYRVQMGEKMFDQLRG